MAAAEPVVPLQLPHLPYFVVDVISLKQSEHELKKHSLIKFKFVFTHPTGYSMFNARQHRKQEILLRL